MTAYTFFITSLIIILIPGTGVIYTISAGITNGKKAGVLAALGCTLGIIPHLCASIALSSLLLNMSYEVFTVIKFVGALYLLYLGAGMIRSKAKLESEYTEAYNNPASSIRTGILINLLNPKLTLFFFSFLPQYVSSDRNGFALQSFLLGVAFMLLSLVVFIGYAILAGTAKKLIIGSPMSASLLPKCFGIVFVIFAVKLALSPL